MKQFALLGATVVGVVGGYIPMMFGDIESMIGWSIVGSMIGGFVGIWAGVRLYKAIN